MRKCIFLMILLPVLGCKTMTKSVSLGGAVGALSGAGLGGGIYWQDRRQAAILGGIVGLGVGIFGAYYLHKENKLELLKEVQNVKKTEKELFESRISEALSYCMDEERAPVLKPRLRESVKKGGRILGGGVNWELKPNEFHLTPEKVDLLEKIERRDESE